jgi:hypothetical protein
MCTGPDRDGLETTPVPVRVTKEEPLSRFLGLCAFMLSLSVMHPAFADHGDNNDHNGDGHENDDQPSTTRSVPELSGSGAASAFAVIVGGTAIAFGRRRQRAKK